MGRRRQNKRKQKLEKEEIGQRVELDIFDQAPSSSSEASEDEMDLKKEKKIEHTPTHHQVNISVFDDEDPIIVLPSLFDSLERQVKDLRRRVFKFSKSSLSGPLRDRKKKKAEEALFRAKELLYHVEQVYLRADEQQQIVYEIDLNRLKNRILKLDKELEELKQITYSDRQRLLMDEKEMREGAPSPTAAYDQDGEILVTDMQRAPSPVQYIIDLQSDNLRRLEGLIDLNEDTIQIGQRAAIRLKAQRERMELIDREVAEIGTGMKRAKQEMRSLYRNLACSKVIIILVALVGILAVAVLITNLVLQSFGIKLIGPNSVISNAIKKKKQQNQQPTALHINSLDSFLFTLLSYLLQ